MNPHFAFSAIFALGLRGIEKKLSLPYGPIGSPGVTRDTLIKLPTSLESATAAFKREDSLAREVMGDYFVDHFAGTREHELEVFRKAVTDWEGGFILFFPLSSFLDQRLFACALSPPVHSSDGRGDGCMTMS
jgi:glutamine synthetase